MQPIATPVTTVLVVVLLLGLSGCSNKKREEGSKKLTQQAAQQIQAAEQKMNEYDFDAARKLLYELREEVQDSPYADVATYDKLIADVDAAHAVLQDKESDFYRKKRQGYSVVDGKLLSAAEKAAPQAQPRAAKQRAARLPAHEVVLDDSSDTPIKTQVELRITLEKRPSESDLRRLLRSLYEEAMDRSGFKFRAHPNAVYIYAYAKKSYRKNSGASWIGMLSCAVDDKEPAIRLDSSRLKAQFEESAARLGLTEQQRKKIYWELFEIEDKARREAERKVPNPKTLEDLKRQAGEFNKLHERYRKRLLRKHRITGKQRIQIIVEGMQKNWPEPSP